MKDLKVRDIINVTGGKLIIGDEDLICKSYSKDTRQIKKDDTYIGIKGETFDGSAFWRQAFEKGASCVIVENINLTNTEKEEFKGKTMILVDDTLEALYAIARYKRSLYNIPVIAITGSVGKTSTKDLVANVVSQKYKTLKTIGNYNNNIGLPFTILRMQEEEVMVLEMGMNHFGEISLLSSIAKPNICIVTNIGTSHIGNLGSRENILKAKLEILENAEDPYIIINKDNDLLNKWYEENKSNEKIITYGIKEKSNYSATEIKLNEEDSEFVAVINNKKEKIKVPVAGEHYILNSLCACCVGKVLNIESDKIKEGIETFELTQKRMTIRELKNGAKIINDAYNASPEAVCASLKVLNQYKGNRKIAVLGDMFELGEYSKQLHEKVGKAVVENNIDVLICSGENAKSIVEKAIELGMNKNKVYYFEDKEKIITFLDEKSKEGDVILFKASNAMKFYELADRVKA